jgi:thiol-disulfide isomerase/thioredoxin
MFTHRPLYRSVYGGVMPLLGALLLGSLNCAAAPATAPLSGVWDATVHVGAIDVPFEFGIAVKGDQASGWFFNGEQRVVSSSGSFTDHHLVLRFDSYAKKLDAQLGVDGKLEGVYAVTTEGASAPPVAFHAHRANPEAGNAQASIPSIAGQWLVPTQSAKSGENAWRLIVRQSGAQVSAAILRVDGDTGALTGRWQDGKLLLSHFDGARPALIELRPGENGNLQLTLHNSNGTDVPLTAYRQAQASAQGLPDAADPANHTSVKNPQEPLQFSFPDLSGQIVSNTDPRFRGKVVLVDISGSWCPNCHDEAPFLQAMYRKYRGRGLEIVTLNFEDSPEQLAHPARLRAFIKDFGIQYIVLQAGTTQQLHDKLPQAVNLDAYPTTFFIGRDGLVRGAHAGFAAPATGDFNAELKKSFAAQIERLLAEKAPAKVATAAVPARDLPAARR